MTDTVPVCLVSAEATELRGLLARYAEFYQLKLLIAPDAKGFKGIVQVGTTPNGFLAQTPGVPTLLISGCKPEWRTEHDKVTFSDDSEVPFPFRGRTLSVRVPRGNRLQCQTGEKVLASTSEGPQWVVSGGPSTKRFRSAWPLPHITPSSFLVDLVNGDDFVPMLPLLDFLKGMSPLRFDSQKPRACFMFDDPNLHWPRYGFVEYGRIAESAKRNNYHVSFATIPLDSWYANKQACATFRKNSSHLSLCIHGNNHTKKELARDLTEKLRRATLTQSLARISRLEQSSGLQVDRVMVPPHGACSEEMLRELPHFGFECATISHGSLKAHNPRGLWSHQIGCTPSELINGCPVLPRWPFCHNSVNSILLAAYLNQPLIIRGHHEDLRGGLDILEAHASLINSLGTVLWGSLSTVARGNYQSFTRGGTLLVIPGGLRMDIELGEGCEELVILSAASLPAKWRIADESGARTEYSAGTPFPRPVGGRARVFAEAVVNSPPTPPSSCLGTAELITAVSRRFLTEGRDRIRVYLPSRAAGK